MNDPHAPSPDHASPHAQHNGNGLSVNGHRSSPRRRVVVAGQRSSGGALAARVAAAVGQDADVVAVPGALAAMAEVATNRPMPLAPNTADSESHDAPSTHVANDRVVLAVECLAGIEASALSALRSFGLRRGLVIVDADPEAKQALRVAGASAFVGEDADAAELRSALAFDELTALTDPTSIKSAEPSPSASPTDATQSEAQPKPSDGDGLIEAIAFPAHSETADALRLAGANGDGELVQAILDIGAEGGRRAPRVALEIAQRRSGWPDLQFLVEGRGQTPASHASAVVAFRGEVYGRLHADPGTADRDAAADSLRPWADWLARWIALDQQARRLRDMAMRDELTGVWNRRYFDRFLNRLLGRAGHDRRQVTLMVFDIDDFKKYNDAHGHAAGDEILKGAAQLMQSVVRDHDVVARIGGDEFAVIFWDAEQRREEGSTHPDDVANIAKRFQRAVCELRFPALARTDMDTLTISGGLAGFPWDGRTPAELLHHADLMALESKRKGKNALTFGSGALRCELPED